MQNFATNKNYFVLTSFATLFLSNMIIVKDYNKKAQLTTFVLMGVIVGAIIAFLSMYIDNTYKSIVSSVIFLVYVIIAGIKLNKDQIIQNNNTLKFLISLNIILVFGLTLSTFFNVDTNNSSLSEIVTDQKQIMVESPTPTSDNKKVSEQVSVSTQLLNDEQKETNECFAKWYTFFYQTSEQIKNLTKQKWFIKSYTDELEEIENLIEVVFDSSEKIKNCLQRQNPQLQNRKTLEYFTPDKSREGLNIVLENIQKSLKEFLDVNKSEIKDQSKILLFQVKLEEIIKFNKNIPLEQ